MADKKFVLELSWEPEIGSTPAAFDLFVSKWWIFEFASNHIRIFHLYSHSNYFHF
jgi:hypothetical protein